MRDADGQEHSSSTPVALGTDAEPPRNQAAGDGRPVADGGGDTCVSNAWTLNTFCGLRMLAKSRSCWRCCACEGPPPKIRVLQSGLRVVTSFCFARLGLARCHGSTGQTSASRDARKPGEKPSRYSWRGLSISVSKTLLAACVFAVKPFCMEAARGPPMQCRRL